MSGRPSTPCLLVLAAAIIAGCGASPPAVPPTSVPPQGSVTPTATAPASSADSATAAPAATRVTAAARAIATLQERLRVDPDDAAAYRDLGLALLQRVRETGDPSLYARADEAFRRARARRPNDPGLLVGIGALQLARHEFAAALATGRSALAIEPSLVAAQGVVVDALVELGRYEEAVRQLQVMIDLRPDLSSLARVSYLRELHGDLPGALEAMRAARRAGGASAENVAFVTVLEGNLLVWNGRRDEAAAAYAQALRDFPGYAPALAGQARLAVAEGDLARAIDLFGRAVATLPLPEYVVALGEAQEAYGDLVGARRSYDLVRAQAQLYRSSGVKSDLELALFEANHGDPAQALISARAAYAGGRTVRTADVLAWALHKAGDVPGARRLIAEATRLGTRDPLLLYHAGAIAAAADDRVAARRNLTAALALDAGFSATDVADARRLLARLETP